MTFPPAGETVPFDPSGRPHVVHVVASLDPRHGGPSRSVAQLAEALSQRGDVEVTLLSEGPAGRSLRRLAIDSRPALIHSHGLWLPVNHRASRVGRGFGIPVVVHPRGMLAPWALARGAWKKRTAMALYQRRDLETAAALIATSPSEYDDIRRLGIGRPVAIIPNGVRLDVSPVPKAAAPEPDGRVRTVLFLSRIHPGKGLVNLLEAWRLVSPEGWRLRIAGPDEGGHLAEVLALIRQWNLGHSVEYVGTLDDRAKAECYRSADLFVLPTFSESFGIVVAEALAHGVPAITTRAAPWSDLERYGCGWWIDVGSEPLSAALRQAMALTDDERRTMGQSGREYVRRYAWDEIGRQTVEVYQWILGLRARPDCVRTD